jgi:hypothetical protein
MKIPNRVIPPKITTNAAVRIRYVNVVFFLLVLRDFRSLGDARNWVLNKK